jgi:hypothetical protein
LDGIKLKTEPDGNPAERGNMLGTHLIHIEPTDKFESKIENYGTVSEPKNKVCIRIGESETISLFMTIEKSHELLEQLIKVLEVHHNV